MHESPEHDAHVLDGLIERVEASLRLLDDAPEAVRAQVQPRQAAVAELRAARPPGPEVGGGGLLERAQRVLERFAGDAGSDRASDVASDRGLSALEREEDALQARFEAALGDDRLSGPARDAVLRAYDRVKPGHDAVRQAALSARDDL